MADFQSNSKKLKLFTGRGGAKPSLLQISLYNLCIQRGKTLYFVVNSSTPIQMKANDWEFEENNVVYSFKHIYIIYNRFLPEA